MLTIAVQFLTGRYVATASHHRDQPEWPPHPARLFSALVATWADVDDPDDAERTALEWLESQPPPSIDAAEADARPARTHFVPTNDASVLGLSLQDRRYERVLTEQEKVDCALEEADGDLSATPVVRALAKLDKARDVTASAGRVGRTPTADALKLLPQHRGRQPRTYPSVTPHDDVVRFSWSEATPSAETRAALDRLLSRVVRLGHSSSFVSCRIDDGPVTTGHRYVPDGRGGLQLRCTGPGQLRALMDAHERHQASLPRSLPHRAARYRDRVEHPQVDVPNLASSWLSGELIVFRRTSGDRPPITAGVAAARALRGALLAHAEEPICEELSGHVPSRSNGSTAPTQRPHTAFLALPFVGSQHATGRLMGVGVLLPAEIADEPRIAILRAIGRWEAAHDFGDLPLKLGRSGLTRLARVVGNAEARNLRPVVWARPATTWASVTPIALDRHPGDLWGTRPERARAAFERARTSIVGACVNVGLPEPRSVEVSLQPLVTGSRPAQAFPRFRQGRGARAVQRALVHARVVFPEPVVGPLLLGAGRFLGLGLLRPFHDTGEEQ